MTDQITKQLHDAVATLTPSARLRSLVLEVPDDGAVPLAVQRRRRPRRTVIAATVGLAAVGVASAAAATGLFAHPDPIDAAAVKRLPSAGAYSVHQPGWRPELQAERYRCTGGPGQDLRGIAAWGPLDGAMDTDWIVTQCERDAADMASAGMPMAPSAEDPKVCQGSFASEELSEVARREDRFIAVVLDDRSCEQAGFTTTDPAQLLAIVNDRRARETRFLARFATGTCLTADEALRIAEDHLSDLGTDFTTHTTSRGDDTICFQPQVSWERHNAELHQTQERP